MPLPRVAIEARAVADPELRFSQSGTAVARLRVVASDRRKNPQTDEWEDGDQLWLDVTCFKQLAENIVESVQKGDLLLIQGRLRTEEWDDRESGQKRSKVSLIADVIAASLQFRVLPHAGGEHAQRAAQRAPAPVQQAYGGQEAPSSYGQSPWGGQGEEPPF